MCNKSGNTAYDGYGVIPKILWGNRQFLRIRNATSRLMYIYLRTGPEFSPSGLFHIDPMSLAFAACCEVGEVHIYMRVLQNLGLLEWDVDSDVVWMKGVREHFVKTASVDQMELIDRDVARVLPCPLQEAYVEEFGINPQMNLETDAMEVAISQVIGRSVMLMDWQEKTYCKDLARVGYTAEQIISVFGPEGAWYQHDWRGQKGQRPTFNDVKAHFEPLLGRVGEEREVKYKVDRERLEKMLKALVKANKGAGFAKTQVVEEFGQPIWDKLRAVKEWHEWLQIDDKDVKWTIVEALR